jgi:hypothetical protein
MASTLMGMPAAQSYRFESCRVQHCRSSLADNYSCWN